MKPSQLYISKDDQEKYNATNPKTHFKYEIQAAQPFNQMATCIYL